MEPHLVKVPGIPRMLFLEPVMWRLQYEVGKLSTRYLTMRCVYLKTVTMEDCRDMLCFPVALHSGNYSRGVTHGHDNLARCELLIRSRGGGSGVCGQNRKIQQTQFCLPFFSEKASRRKIKTHRMWLKSGPSMAKRKDVSLEQGSGESKNHERYQRNRLPKPPNGWQVTPKQPLPGHSTDHLPAIGRSCWRCFCSTAPSLSSKKVCRKEAKPSAVPHKILQDRVPLFLVVWKPLKHNRHNVFGSKDAFMPECTLARRSVTFISVAAA